jgi:hypothetical protein
MVAKEDEMAGSCCKHGKEVNAYRVLAGKILKKGITSKSRHGWEGNIKK